MKAALAHSSFWARDRLGAEGGSLPLRKESRGSPVPSARSSLRRRLAAADEAQDDSSSSSSQSDEQAADVEWPDRQSHRQPPVREQPALSLIHI